MTPKLSATERRLRDAFNACPWGTDALRISHGATELVIAGMRQEDADKEAEAAYPRWQEATKIAGPG